jgi:hypothetical protein
MWWVLLLEAGVALFLLLFIVWWTMFSGPKPEAPAKKDMPPRSDAPPAQDDTLP